MSLYMRVYPHSDPLVRLLALLWIRGDRSLIQLIEDVCQQHYGQPAGVIAKVVELAGFITSKIKKEVS